MDNMDGQGTFSWTDGRIYKGGWRNNMPHGNGKMVSSSGEIKLGLWENGKRVKWFKTTELNLKRQELNDL